MCFLHRTFAINSSFFPPLSLHIAAPNPQAGFLFYYSATPIFSSSFGSVVNAVLFCFKPPSPHLLHITPHLTHTLHPFAWLTKPRSSSAERRRHSLVTRKEIERMITTRFPLCYPAFLYITRRRWQITMCLVGSQPNSLRTQEITPSFIVALSNSCPLSENPGSDFWFIFPKMSIVGSKYVWVKDGFENSAHFTYGLSYLTQVFFPHLFCEHSYCSFPHWTLSIFSSRNLIIPFSPRVLLH